ncbi:hypothetical protein C8R45DRAFT_134877 [Mycena sanguinolenta]|nr:hypothetical protein C8R45DRAFT_134877 [Mycena sanguinolenta]
MQPQPSQNLPLQPILTQPQPSSYGGSNYSNEPKGNPSSEEPLTPPPPRPSAQATQDKEDENARRQAIKDLVQSWLDRLQLISVITTFFASTEAGMLQVVTTGKGEDAGSQVANSAFLAALVLHIWAAIISFMGAFFLVRYNLKEAKEEEREVGLAPGITTSPTRSLSPLQLPRARTDASITDYLRLQPVWTTNPHLEQVGPFHRNPPTHLLGRVHNLCIALTFVGFGLALFGILAYAWVQNPVSVGIVTSLSTLVCFVAAVWVFVH